MRTRRSKFRSCVILAPFGADTSVLRLVLEEHGIRWSDQSSLTPGVSWADLLTRQIPSVDFVCAAIPSGFDRSNVLFELGIAFGQGKPILAFVHPSERVSFDLTSLTHVRSDLTDARSIGLALSAFLEHASRKPQRAMRVPIRTGEGVREYASASTARAFDYERETADLFNRAGFMVSEPTERSDHGADLAIWIDELQLQLGNPVLVEIRSGDLSVSRLLDAAERLRSNVLKTHGHCGLLVYWDASGREFPVRAAGGLPLILQLSGQALRELVTSKKLVKELIRQRNVAVHGGL